MCQNRSRMDENWTEAAGDFLDEKALLRKYDYDPEQARNIMRVAMEPGNEKSHKFHPSRNVSLYLDVNYSYGHRHTDTAEESRKRKVVTRPGKQYVWAIGLWQ